LPLLLSVLEQERVNAKASERLAANVIFERNLILFIKNSCFISLL